MRSDIYHVEQIFKDDPELIEVYAARCCDAGEPASREDALSFRDVYFAQNRDPQTLTLRELRIGPSAAGTCSLQFHDKNFTKLDLG